VNGCASTHEGGHGVTHPYFRHPCRIQLSVWVRSAHTHYRKHMCGNGQCSLQACTRTPA
jgi:hypothetical protein